MVVLVIVLETSTAFGAFDTSGIRCDSPLRFDVAYSARTWILHHIAHMLPILTVGVEGFVQE